MFRAPVEKAKSGFTIIEIMIVLAIAGVILAIIFLSLPAMQRGWRNHQRKHDVALIQAALLDYYYNHGNNMPGPFSGGTCFAYYLPQAAWRCNTGTDNALDWFTSLTSELSYYKDIPTQYFYATDQGGYTGTRNLSIFVNTDEIFIDSDSKCSGDTQEAWTDGVYKTHEIIVYALENGGSTPDYQCVDVLGTNPSGI